MSASGKENSMMNWRSIKSRCVSEAVNLGHKPGKFARPSNSPFIRMMSCETCGGCCWVGWSLARGFGFGGRIVRYRCGTPEAQGFLSEARTLDTAQVHNFEEIANK